MVLVYDGKRSNLPTVKKILSPVFFIDFHATLPLRSILPRTIVNYLSLVEISAHTIH